MDFHFVDGIYMKSIRRTFQGSLLLIALFVTSTATGFAESVLPVPVLTVPPVYPPDMRREGRTADVTVEFLIDKNGLVSSAQVTPKSASVPWQFQYAAVVAIWQWKFTPGVKDGKTVIVRAQQTLNFNLIEEPNPHK